MLFRAGFVYCILWRVCECTSPIMQRIVGGTTTSIAKIPYQIAFYVNNQFSCGGSLITKNCVLTAGHCVKGLAASGLKVRAGITHLSNIDGETRTVLHTYFPPQFNLKSLEMDVAILRLNASLSGTNIATIELSDKNVNVGDQLQVSGWGFTNENATITPNQLRVVTVQIISKAQCSRQYPSELKDSMFCAGVHRGGKDSCAGDSGGPAVKDGRQIGIVSWGRGCGRADSSGVYTSVKHILPWVNGVKSMYCGIK